MNKTFATGLVTKERRRERVERGTSLIELMVAVAVFIVISTAAFLLLSQQQSASIGVNGRVGLNLALRNSVSMLQMDLANAASYYYQIANNPGGALGVTLVNNVVTAGSGSGCYTAPTGASVIGTYGASCFDTLNIIQVDSTYPVLNATDSTGGFSASANCSNTSTGFAYGQLGTLNPATLPYKIGDQLLLIQNGGLQYTSVVLTAVPTVSGTAIKFTFHPTTSTTVAAGGPLAGTVITGVNTLANDPLNISACSGTTPCPPTSVETVYLTQQFCPGGSTATGDFILKLAPITYTVNWTATDYAGNQNPTLQRTQGGVTSNVMEQVIGFKVGGTVWQDPTAVSPDQTYYNYDASSYTLDPAYVGANNGANAYQFTLLRAIRVSLIGRTAPVYTHNYVYRNTFDNGPYQVQGTVVVVNPRNMNF